MFEILDKVTLPEKASQAGKNLKYPWDKIKIGGGFLVPVDPDTPACRKRIYNNILVARGRSEPAENWTIRFDAKKGGYVVRRNK